MALLYFKNGVVSDILNNLEIDTTELKTQLGQSLESAPKINRTGNQIYTTPRVAHLLEMAKEESDRLNDEFISVEHIFVAAVRETQGVTSVLLQRFGIDQEKVYSALMQVRGNHRVDDPKAESKYGTLEKLLKFAHEIKQNKRRETLLENKDKALLSKQLVTLKKDSPVERELTDFKLKEIDKDKLYKFLREMEFNRLLSSAISAYGEPNLENWNKEKVEKNTITRNNFKFEINYKKP